MTQSIDYTTKAWGFFVPNAKASLARQWFQAMKTDRADDMQEHMQTWLMSHYQAWLQETEGGFWLIERWQTPARSFENIQETLKTVKTPYLDWCLEWKERLHDGQFNQLQGVRQLCDITNNTHHTETHSDDRQEHILMAPLKPGMLPTLVTSLDEWQRESKQSLMQHIQTNAIAEWELFIETINDQEYAISYLRLNGNAPNVKNHFTDTIKQLSLDCFGQDIFIELEKTPLETLIDVKCDIKTQNPHKNDLYPCEIETLYWAARGKTTEETAMILNLSGHTIATYRKLAIQKLNASNITHAVFIATGLGLISPKS